MSRHWNTVPPTICNLDGVRYQVPDYVAFNWMHSGTACVHIKYAYCVHPDLERKGDVWQYDTYWNEYVPMFKPALRIVVKEKALTSEDASRQFVVFSISRLYLQHELRFTHDQVCQLTDNDMQLIADDLKKSYSYMEDSFGKLVHFLTTSVLMGKGTRTTGQQEEKTDEKDHLARPE